MYLKEIMCKKVLILFGLIFVIYVLIKLFIVYNFDIFYIF